MKWSNEYIVGQMINIPPLEMPAIIHGKGLIRASR